MYPNFVPKRFMGRTGYQVFVDRFFRVGEPPTPIEGRKLKEWTDEIPDWKPERDGKYRNLYFYGGNLRGIIEKLDYIESLGANLLYLSPISETRSSHHYDVEDQRKIDPWIGTWEDFRLLCKKAHKKDILVCVDLVFNHMGINSHFYKEALNDVNSKYRGWFEWDENGKPVFWYGFKDLPQCNKLNPDYQEYTFDVAKKYITEGADGIRLDLGENFPAEYMQKFRSKVKELNPEALIVSEMWELATTKGNPQIYGDQVDSVMNYPMADAICRWVRYGNVGHFMYTFNEIGKYPIGVQNVLWNFLDSHDTPRILNMLTGPGINENPFSGRAWDIEAPWRKHNLFDTYSFRKWELENDAVDKELALHRLKIAVLLQYFITGIPIVYYGTENEITGYKDPFNRKPFQWGISKDILNYYKEIGKFRKENQDILKNGLLSQETVTENVIAMHRRNEEGMIVVAINRTSKEQENPLKHWNLDEWNEIFNLENSSRETLKPYGAVVYRLISTC